MSLFNRKKQPAVPLHAARIEDYALIGDCETAALVSRTGSIDWLCWPDFASGACFAALLGTAENGCWQLCPAGEVLETTRRYRPGTLVLETTMRTATGEICITDFMPPRGNFSDVFRRVRCTRGSVPMRMHLTLRFDYGLTIPWVTTHGADVLRAIAGPNMVTLRSHCMDGHTAELHGEGLSTVSEFTLRAGREACFTLTYTASTAEIPQPDAPDTALEQTVSYWCEWIERSTYRGSYRDPVERSLLTLEALTYKPTGGIVAAPTMGLPERIGGERNWDYRFCWLRDTSFTLLVLLRAGYTEEAERWRHWLLRAIAGAPDQVQALYGIQGERMLQETDIGWLRGYEDSRPVRSGNAAALQFQLDMFGEVVLALERMPTASDDLRAPAAELQASLVNHLCHVWDQPDDGIWETRGGRKHFVYSKVMAWAALDRAIRGHEQMDGKGDVKRWRKNRDMLHREICKRGFNKKLNSFTQSYGSTTLDASCLRIGMVGFLPMDDPRIVGTVEAIEKKLMRGGFVARYDTKVSGDGLSGTEGSFLACSFWMVICLHLIGRRGEARQMYERLLALQNDVGLLSEEYDGEAGRMLGNFPQALSHIALVHAAFTLDGVWKPELGEQPR